MQTLEEYLKDWLTLRSGVLRVRTVESYESLIRLHIAPILGHVAVDQLNALDIRPCLAGIVAKGHTRTAELCYVMLKAALADLEPSPMKGVPRPMHVQSIPDAWSDDQISVYMNALKDHPHGLALSLGLGLGLRRGEICGLRWQDIDFDAEEIYVCNQRMRLDSGKIIDAPPPLMARLRRERQLSGYIDGITPSGLDAAHRALVHRLALPYLPLHGLRHSMATSCIRHGGEMRALQDVLGHADYSVTANRYTHPDSKMRRSAVDAAATSWYTISMR